MGPRLASPDKLKTSTSNVVTSLSFKVALIVSTMMLVVLLVLSTVFIIFEERKIRQDIARNGETFATFSALAIYENYSQFYTHPQPSDFQIFKENVTEILSHNKDITKATLISLSGRILFDTDEFKDGKYTSTTYRTINDDQMLTAVNKTVVNKRGITVNGKDVTEIIVPLKETGGGHVISMRFLLSYDSLRPALNEAIGRLALLIIGLTVFVLAAAIIFSLGLVRPIVSLTGVAERLSGGDLNARANVRSKDEIGRLAQTFNIMADTIKTYIADLKESQAKIQEQNYELRYEQVRLKASINSLNAGFIMTDATDDVVLLNQTAENILSYVITKEGVSNEESVRHDWTAELIDQKFKQSFAYRDTLHKIRNKGEAVEFQELPYNGRMLHVFMAPIFDIDPQGRVKTLGSVTLLEDVTEAKILERSKDEFFSIASHELRTPLTAIRGNASMIESYFAKQLKDASLKEMVGDIHESSTRLIEIVNDFLDVSRLEQGKIQYVIESFELDKIIERVAYEMGASLKQRGIHLEIEQLQLKTLPNVQADKSRVQQVLYNLIGNSVKFTPKGGTISISVEKLKDSLKVYVKDTGEGMTPEAQRLLFHKFQQAGQSLYTRNTERGTGLGLYICKLMLEQMNGTIQLESSAKGKGSTFSFTMPISKDPTGTIIPTETRIKADQSEQQDSEAPTEAPQDTPDKPSES